MGDRSSGDGLSVQVAWAIENYALGLGWSEGCSLGSEVDLTERFKVNRDVLRGALRLVESRGAMRVERGRRGGLRLHRPSTHGIAATLAGYLGAWDYQPAYSSLLPAMRQVLTTVDHGGRFAELMDEATRILSAHLTDDASSRTRAELVAVRLINEVGKPIPENGVSLGCEAELCDRFGLAHRTFRQSVSILQDLGMLTVNRGRGGGYLIHRPSKIGISRRLFAWIAADCVDPVSAIFLSNRFNVIKLRLAWTNLQALPEADRNDWCDRLLARIDGVAESERWVLVQKAIANCANDRMINTVVSGLLAYIARLRFAPDLAAYDKELLPEELNLIERLRSGSYKQAEAALEKCQVYLIKLAQSHAAPSSSTPDFSQTRTA